MKKHRKKLVEETTGVSEQAKASDKRSKVTPSAGKADDGQGKVRRRRGEVGGGFG